VGPEVGGAVTQGLHWTWIFWLNVPVGLIAIPLAAKVLRESRGGSGRLDPLGLALSSIAILALVWGVVNGSDDGWTSTPVLTALIGGTALLAGFLAWERRAAAPMLPLHLFNSRQFSVINAVAFIFSAGVFGAVFLLAQFLQVVQGIDPLAAGLRTLPWTIAPMFVAPLAGLVLVGRFGGRALIITGMTLLTVALTWLALTSTKDVSYGDLVVAFVLAGVGMGLMFAPMSTLTLESAPSETAGVASGTLNTMRELGVAVGVAVLASVFAAHGNYTTPTAFAAGIQPALWTGAAMTAAGTALATFLPKHRP
jgi:EmrB/QacA subfamily drug resistance transporter